MDQRFLFKNRLVALLKRRRDLPLFVIKFLTIGIHTVFFSWWLDKRFVRRNDQLFAQGIGDLGFLFNAYGARTVLLINCWIFAP